MTLTDPERRTHLHVSPRIWPTRLSENHGRWRFTSLPLAGQVAGDETSNSQPESLVKVLFESLNERQKKAVGLTGIIRMAIEAPSNPCE